MIESDGRRDAVAALERATNIGEELRGLVQEMRDEGRRRDVRQVTRDRLVAIAAVVVAVLVLAVGTILYVTNRRNADDLTERSDVSRRRQLCVSAITVEFLNRQGGYDVASGEVNVALGRVVAVSAVRPVDAAAAAAAVQAYDAAVTRLDAATRRYAEGNAIYGTIPAKCYVPDPDEDPLN